MQNFLFQYFDFPLTATCTKIHDLRGNCVLDMRGWGYLTGHGHKALGMDHEVAANIQDKMAEEVAQALNDLWRSQTDEKS